MSELAVIFAKVVRHHSHCVVCKANGPQYHHVDPSTKLSEVSRVARTGDLSLTIKEINKCIPLCQTHHTAVHKGVIPGYLDGKYDNGMSSEATFARQYMPYMKWFAHRKKHVLMEFYREFVEKDGDAIMSVFNAANLSLPGRPRLRVVEGGLQTARSVQSNKDTQTWPPPGTIPFRHYANDSTHP